MNEERSQLDRFTRAVHRRLLLVRAIEGAGLALLVSAAFALPLTVALLWQDRPALAAAVVTLSLGAAAGLLAALLLRRPTLYDAAAEADRQLELSDLLATALAARASVDPWQRAVVAMADARCATLKPNAVVLHRFGGRAWGGIALATALVLTLGLLSVTPAEAPARDARPEDDQATALAAAETDPEPPGRRDELLSAAHDRAAASPREYLPQDASESGRGAMASDDADPAPPRAVHDASASRRTADAGGVGSASASSVTRRTQPAPAPAPSPRAREGIDDPTAPTAGGGRMSEAHPDAGAAASSSVTSSSAAAPGAGRQSPVPPWRSPSWPTDVAAAEQAVRSGRVGDGYRDVLRAYFRRDEDRR